MLRIKKINVRALLESNIRTFAADRVGSLLKSQMARAVVQ